MKKTAGNSAVFYFQHPNGKREAMTWKISKKTLKSCRNFSARLSGAVFFGGAGVSTESGIPDFRSQDGLYHQKYKFPPETILSHTFFMRHTDEFYEFYREKMLCLDALPNAAHKRLAQWKRRVRSPR